MSCFWWREPHYPTRDGTPHGDILAGYMLRDRMVCADGFTVSIQANRGAYCSPRDEHGPWREVELGFPSARPTDAIMRHAEDEADPTGTVYGYVPVELVEELIAEHGGPAEGKATP